MLVPAVLFLITLIVLLPVLGLILWIGSVVETFGNGSWPISWGLIWILLAALAVWGLWKLWKHRATKKDSEAAAPSSAKTKTPSEKTPSPAKGGMRFVKGTLFWVGMAAIALLALYHVRPTWYDEIKEASYTVEKYAGEKNAHEWRVAKVEFDPSLPFQATKGHLAPTQPLTFLKEPRDTHYRAWIVVDTPTMTHKGKVYRGGVVSFFAFPDAMCVTDEKTREVECQGHWQVNFSSGDIIRGEALIRSAKEGGRDAIVATMRNYPDQPEREFGKVTLVRNGGAG